MLEDELSLLLLYGLLVAIVLGLKTTGMITQFDMGYLLSARDEPRRLPRMLSRLDRAIWNSITALALVTPPILAIVHRDQGSPQSQLAAQVFLACRLVYFPAYMFGVPGLRTAVWLGGFVATIVLYFLAL
jgi:uncharacterized MAPEG superfamily protein